MVVFGKEMNTDGAGNKPKITQFTIHGIHGAIHGGSWTVWTFSGS